MRLGDLDALSLAIRRYGILLNDEDATDEERERYMLRLIEKQPTIDPDTLRPKGRWIESEPGYRLCSHCMADVAIYSGHTNYCPNCGAKMMEV